jgi:hypothetical protein
VRVCSPMSFADFARARTPEDVAAGAGARSWTPRPNVRVCSPMSFADFARARTPVFRWLYVRWLYVA